MDTPSQREQRLFEAARDLKDPAQRSAYLDEACAGDGALRQGVEALLAVDAGSETFFAEGALALQQSALSMSEAEQPGDRIGPVDAIGAGRYKLLEKIGEGGCGTVYMAEQEQPVRRRVALKIIKLGMDTQSVVARFEAERQALALMEHPNIARIYDAGTTDSGRPYFVMELVRGVKITEYCDEQKLSTHERLELFLKVCDAVQHAHQKGIIHRDLKPSNVLVTVNDGVAVPKVIDFGIAKAVQGRLTDQTLFTGFEQLLGTPAYMSPEQALMSSADVDTRSDIYSLGVLLYELLTGLTPFDARTLLQEGIDKLRQTIREREPMRPSTRLRSMPGEELTTTARRRRTEVPNLLQRVSGDLDWIVMKCLEKDRGRRYETANGLATDIRRHLSNEPVVARPPSAAYRFQRLVLRNKLAFGAAAMVMLALALGLAVAMAGLFRERLANQETRRRAYAAEMSAASFAFEEHNLSSVTELLNRQRPRPGEEDLRGLEWRYLWAQSRGNQLTMLRGHRSGVREVAFSGDGKLLASASLDQTVRVWDVASGETLHELPGPIDQNLHQSVAFSPDSQILAVASGGKLFLWKTSDWQLLRPPLVDATPPVAFSPDGQVLVARASSELRLWDTATWETTALKTESSQGVRGCLDISPDSRRLAFGFSGGAPLQIWDLADRTKMFELDTTAACLTFLSGGDRLAIGTWATRQISLLDMTSKKVLTNYSIGAKEVVFGAVFSQDEKVLASPVGQEIHLFEVATGRLLAELRGHHGEVHALKHSRVAPLLASAGMDGLIGLWRDQPPGEPHQQEVPPDLEFLSLSSARPQLYSRSTNGALQFWDLRMGRLVPTVFLSSGAMLTREFGGRGALTRKFSERMQISPDGGYAAVGTKDGQVHVFESAVGGTVGSLPVGQGNIRAAAFSPDNKLLLTAEEGNADLRATESDAHGLLWNWQTKQIEASLPNAFCGPWDLPAGTFSPDGRLLAYVSQGYAVNLWDVAAKRLRCTLEGHGWIICGINFSPDSRLLATSSFDRTTCLWDLGAQCPSPRKFYGKTEFFLFSRDSRTLVTADPEPSVRFWNIATGHQALTIPGATSAMLAPDESAILLWRPEGVSLVRIPTLAEIDDAERRR